jgi:DNA-directed RNA polymerase subunit RPC12/RpoP
MQTPETVPVPVEWTVPLARAPSKQRLRLSLHKLSRVSVSGESQSADNSPNSSSTSTNSPKSTRSDTSLPRLSLGSLSAGRTTARDEETAPVRCPLCRGTTVCKLERWPALDGTIYACGTEPGPPGKVCGWWFVWRSGRAVDTCVTCIRCGANRRHLLLEIREAKPGFWCRKCNYF